jgi:hypothetical protein
MSQQIQKLQYVSPKGQYPSRSLAAAKDITYKRCLNDVIIEKDGQNKGFLGLNHRPKINSPKQRPINLIQPAKQETNFLAVFAAFCPEKRLHTPKHYHLRLQ